MTSPRLSEIINLERQVWDALVTGDVGADSRLLSNDFLGVYASGFSDRAGHVGQLDAGPSIATYDLTDLRLLTPGPGLAMLCYRADFVRMGSSTLESMLVSSLWKQTGAAWRNIFSQDTTVGPAGTGSKT